MKNLIVLFSIMFAFAIGCASGSSTDKSSSEPDANSGRDVPEAWKVGEPAEIEKVTLRTSDGIEIAASFRPASEGSNDKVPAFVLIPMLSRTKSDYDKFTEHLSEVGIASLAIDLRGHGESTMDGKIRFSSFKEKQWNECEKDINASIGWLKNREDIDQRYLGIIGASIGANFALKVGSRSDITLVVALSPGLDYRGVVVEEDAAKIGKKAVYIVCTDGDSVAKDAADRLTQIMDPSTEVRILENEKFHGTEMFRMPFFIEGVIRWITDKISEMYRYDLNEEFYNRKVKSVKIPAVPE